MKQRKMIYFLSIRSFLYIRIFSINIPENMTTFNRNLTDLNISTLVYMLDTNIVIDPDKVQHLVECVHNLVSLFDNYPNA